MARSRGEQRAEGIWRGIRSIAGLVLVGVGLYVVHRSVVSLSGHDYVASLVLSSVGLFLVASGTSLFRPEVAE